MNEIDFGLGGPQATFIEGALNAKFWCVVFHSNLVMFAVAYAGFWKGGGRNFRKFEKYKDLNQKFSPDFRPKLGEDKKKSTQIQSGFSPKIRWKAKKKKEKIFTQI